MAADRAIRTRPAARRRRTSFRLYGSLPALPYFAIAVAVFVLMFGAWWLAARVHLASSFFLPSPLQVWHRARVLCNDMETSTIFVICALRNLRGGSVLTVVNEPGEKAIDPARVAALDLTPMFQVALAAVRQLAPLEA